MTERREHITVCICTYKRPELLKKLLDQVLLQDAQGSFTVSASVVDNDAALSAKPVIETFKGNGGCEIVYAHAPDKNLAYLRNLSLANARGDYVAFIDDDECPGAHWLSALHQTLVKYRADGVLGPVLPDFLAPPPRWIIKGRICERPRYETGFRLQWWQTRTGNALIKKSLFEDPDNLFDLKYQLGAEDDAFFRKLIDKGHVFVWCDEAIVSEAVPADRLTLTYLQKRSRLIGFMSYYYYRDTRSGLQNLLIALKSSAALLTYLISLPLVRAMGYHRFANQMMRIQHHRAVILTFLGVLTIRERNI